MQVADGLDDRRIQLPVNALHVNDAVAIETRDKTGDGCRCLSLRGGQAFEDGDDLHRLSRGFHRYHLAHSSVQAEREILAGQTGNRCAVGIENGHKEARRSLPGSALEGGPETDSQGREPHGSRAPVPCPAGHRLMYFLTSRGPTSAP